MTNNLNDSKDLALLAMLDASIAEGQACNTSLTALRAALALDISPEYIEALRGEFYTGRVMAKCDLEESAARVQIGLKPYDHLHAEKNTDLNRTKASHSALRVATVKFSEMLKECGIETARSGVGGAPKKDGKREPHHNTAHGSSAPVLTTFDNVQLPSTVNRESAHDLVKALDKRIVALRSGPLAKATDLGDAGAVLRNAFEAFHKALKTALDMLDPKGEADVNPTKAAKIAEIEAMLASLKAAA